MWLAIIKSKTFSLSLIIIFAIVSAQLIASMLALLKFPAQDYEVNYLAGTQLLRSENPYIQVGKDIVRITPPTLVVFAVLAQMPILNSQVVWFMASLLAFMFGSFFLFQAVDLSSEVKIKIVGNWRIWLVYLTLVFCFFPFRYNLGSGQVNNFVFALLALALLYFVKRKLFLSSVYLAIAIVLKITPILFLFSLAVKRQMRMVVLTIAGVTLICLLTLPWIRVSNYYNYLGVPSSFFDFSLSVYTNQSLVGFLARVSSDYRMNQIIYFILLVFVLVWFAKIFGWKNNSFGESLILWNITILMMLIFSPFAWQYQFVIAIIPLVITSYLVVVAKSHHRLFGLVFVCYLLLGWNIKNPTWLQTQGIIGQVVASHTLIGAILLLTINYYLIRDVSTLGNKSGGVKHTQRNSLS